MRLRYLLVVWSVLVLATSCAPPGMQTLETPTTREGRPWRRSGSGRGSGL